MCKSGQAGIIINQEHTASKQKITLANYLVKGWQIICTWKSYQLYQMMETFWTQCEFEAMKCSMWNYRNRSCWSKMYATVKCLVSIWHLCQSDIKSTVRWSLTQPFRPSLLLMCPETKFHCSLFNQIFKWSKCQAHPTSRLIEPSTSIAWSNKIITITDNKPDLIALSAKVFDFKSLHLHNNCHITGLPQVLQSKSVSRLLETNNSNDK